MTPEQRADAMWRIHPRELQDRGITRAAYYAEHIREAIADEHTKIERLRAALDRAADALEFYDNKAESLKARAALKDAKP
ncbi:MAG: hypothetical protein ABWY64_25750 [Tardiphaga sp.]|jgi:hypothetical protein